eukprot:991720-Prorocentrum_minimum.AAC.3
MPVLRASDWSVRGGEHGGQHFEHAVREHVADLARGEGRVHNVAVQSLMTITTPPRPSRPPRTRRHANTQQAQHANQATR